MTRTVGRLHVITDTVLQKSWSHVELAQRAAAGGADVVQFRHKPPADLEWLRTITAAMQRALPATVQLVINDHVDVAQDVAGAGVHLGAADLSPVRARRRLGPDVCIGATANSFSEAEALFDQPVDYLGVGPVFSTLSKANPASPMGLETLQKIAAASPHPIIAIGGIQPQHVASILNCGAHGIAVLSGAVCQPDVLAAVGTYRWALQQALPKSASTEWSPASMQTAVATPDGTDIEEET